MMRTVIMSTLLLATVAIVQASTDQKPESGAPDSMANCPMHAQHVKANGEAKHGAEVDARHDTLGMSHQASTHSFRLFADGGAIELRANAASDQDVVGAIRTHLSEIASQFSKSDFKTPAFVHGYPPAGVAEMNRLHSQISYKYEQVNRGGRIRITTSSPQALVAIHDFLKFQVIEHRTANSGKVEEDR